MKSSGYSILCTGGGKVISAELKNARLPTIFQRNAFVPLWHNAPACSSLAQCPSLFHRDSEVLPGEQGCAGGQPPTIFQDTDDIKKNLIFMDPCIVV